MLFRKCAILLRDEVEMEILSYIWYVYSLIFSCMNKKKNKNKKKKLYSSAKESMQSLLVDCLKIQGWNIIMYAVLEINFFRK